MSICVGFLQSAEVSEPRHLLFSEITPRILGTIARFPLYKNIVLVA